MEISKLWVVMFIIYLLVLFWRSKSACLTLLFVMCVTYEAEWASLLWKFTMAFTYLWAMAYPDLHYPESKYSEKWQHFYKKEYDQKIKELSGQNDKDD